MYYIMLLHTRSSFLEGMVDLIYSRVLLQRGRCCIRPHWTMALQHYCCLIGCCAGHAYFTTPVVGTVDIPLSLRILLLRFEIASLPSSRKKLFSSCEDEMKHSFELFLCSG